MERGQQAKIRAGRFKEMNQEKVKADIAEAKRKRDQEKYPKMPERKFFQKLLWLDSEHEVNKETSFFCIVLAIVLTVCLLF